MMEGAGKSVKGLFGGGRGGGRRDSRLVGKKKQRRCSNDVTQSADTMSRRFSEHSARTALDEQVRMMTTSTSLLNVAATNLLYLCQRQKRKCL
jgi:hypothetical protein